MFELEVRVQELYSEIRGLFCVFVYLLPDTMSTTEVV
jgi:hypothetical protein